MGPGQATGGVEGGVCVRFEDPSRSPGVLSWKVQHRTGGARAAPSMALINSVRYLGPPEGLPTCASGEEEAHPRAVPL